MLLDKYQNVTNVSPKCVCTQPHVTSHTRAQGKWQGTRKRQRMEAGGRCKGWGKKGNKWQCQGNAWNGMGLVKGEGRGIPCSSRVIVRSPPGLATTIHHPSGTMHGTAGTQTTHHVYVCVYTGTEPNQQQMEPFFLRLPCLICSLLLLLLSKRMRWGSEEPRWRCASPNQRQNQCVCARCSAQVRAAVGARGDAAQCVRVWWQRDMVRACRRYFMQARAWCEWCAQRSTKPQV